MKRTICNELLSVNLSLFSGTGSEFLERIKTTLDEIESDWGIKPEDVSVDFNYSTSYYGDNTDYRIEFNERRLETDKEYELRMAADLLQKKQEENQKIQKANAKKARELKKLEELKAKYENL